MSFEGTPQPIADLTVRALQYYVGHTSTGLAGKELAPAYGSNANGAYLKFADGTMICTFVDGTGLACATASGSLFTAAANGTWTFPAAFSTTTGMVLSGVSTSTVRWIVTGTITTTTATYNNFSSASSGSAVVLRLMAIGRWL